MKLKLKAGNHQFRYLIGKDKMLNVTVTAKFLMHAKIKLSFCQALKTCTQK